MPPRDRVPGWLSALGTDVLRLIVPVECPGCGAVDTVICRTCLDRLRSTPRRCESGAAHLVPADGGPRLPVWASADYRSPVDRTVIAWKDHNRRDLDPVMRATMARLARAVAPALSSVLVELGSPQLAVLAIPSTPAAVRRRGSWLTHALADAAATALSDLGLPAVAIPALRRPGGGRQVGRSAAQRSRLRRDTTAVHPARVPQGASLLVDDVLTTGSSMLDAERVLSRLGVPVLGGLVLAATRPGTDTGGSELFSGAW